MLDSAWIVNLYTRAMVDIIYNNAQNVNHKRIQKLTIVYQEIVYYLGIKV